MIQEARRHRKLFGGGMRQCGIIAAGALYALQHNRERLAEDHENAQVLADAVRNSDGLTLTPSHVDTNIVIFRVEPSLGSAGEFAAELKAHGLLAIAISSDQIRLVTHLDVSQRDCRRAAEILEAVVGQLARGSRIAREAEPEY
jgi:threonine aldolase